MAPTEKDKKKGKARYEPYANGGGVRIVKKDAGHAEDEEDNKPEAWTSQVAAAQVRLILIQRS